MDEADIDRLPLSYYYPLSHRIFAKHLLGMSHDHIDIGEAVIDFR